MVVPLNQGNSGVYLTRTNTVTYRTGKDSYVCFPVCNTFHCSADAGRRIRNCLGSFPGFPSGSLHIPLPTFPLPCLPFVLLPLHSFSCKGAQSLLSSARGVQHVLLDPQLSLSLLFASPLLKFFLNSYWCFSQAVPLL